MMKKREEIKSLIEKTFTENVLGQEIDLRTFNKAHDGAEGDWLTKKMGLTVNGKNEPDFLGFEMKKDSAKTSFGDWSPDFSLYKDKNSNISRDEFIRIFGAPNPNKGNRYSWSGKVFPNIKNFNYAGQIMRIENLDITIEYSYARDTRSDKINIVPREFHNSNHVIAKWSENYLRQKVESKFNQLGWFKCIKDSSNKYVRLQFGKPINFETFIDLVSTGEIFLDCGMHIGNARPYMTWRANKNIWDRLAE
jgi:hypothetical protein